MGLFSSSKSNSSVVTQAWQDSFNTTNSSSTVLSETGNINLTFGVDSAAEKAIPIIALLVFGIWLLWQSYKK